MKTITSEQFANQGSLFLNAYNEIIMMEGGFWQKKYAHLKDEWSAADILALPDVLDGDKLGSVLCAELVDDTILQAFAGRMQEMFAAIDDAGSEMPDRIAAGHAADALHIAKLRDMLGLTK